MKATSFLTAIPLLTALAITPLAYAQAPAGSTGQCKDGTYTSAESKRGACSGHGGVKEWYATETKSESKSDKKVESKSAEKKSPSTTTTAPATAPSEATKSSSTTTAKKTPETARSEPAPGGGAGKVWINTSSKVYHCSGDKWYGKTKEGEYMTEAQAKASGARPANKKTCS